MTANELIDDIADEVAEPDLSSTGAKASVLQRRLNDTLRDIVSRRLWHWRNSLAPIQIPTVAGTATYTVSGVNNPDIFAVHLVVTSGADSRPLTELREAEMLKQLSPAHEERDYPEFFSQIKSVTTTTLRLYPVPSGVWTLDVWLRTDFVEITNFTTTLLVPNYVIEAVKIGLLARTLRYLREYEAATAAYSLYESLLTTAMDVDRRGAYEPVTEIPGPGYPAPSYWLRPDIRRA